ncbi:hypothetical protein ARMGADRAFT_623409 [Armillaria gallica]|uniref:Uncharacterized protein n=1 Tax=Armillaria gallica TaxID=47427 RepID=A0A2H3CLI8_ARMGA|nr:hypothetical protein ARMGADRAFT_623409 [Armillaria gallica]
MNIKRVEEIVNRKSISMSQLASSLSSTSRCAWPLEYNLTPKYTVRNIISAHGRQHSSAARGRRDFLRAGAGYPILVTVRIAACTSQCCSATGHRSLEKVLLQKGQSNHF